MNRFLILFSWVVLMTSVPINAATPSYSFVEEDGYFQVVVNTNGSPATTQTMMEEAKKSSLFGMAYIHHLANENNRTAAQIASLYEGYRQFFISSDIRVLLDRCEAVLDEAGADSFAVSVATYLKELLTQPKIGESDGKIFIENLIPSIKETLQMRPPRKLHPEQLVQVPEMTASHNAFPDLIKYHDHYYATFREANSHVQYKDYGKVRILRGEFSPDTAQWKWENVALLALEPYDLRDPKFFVDSNDNLRLIVDASLIDEKDSTQKMVPHVAYLEGGEWKIREAGIDPSAGGQKGQWLWRVTWNPFDQAGYGFSYGKDNNNTLCLMRTTDGFNYDKVAEITCEAILDEALNEATIRFKKDGTAVALIRTLRHGLIGIATPGSQYTKWSFEVIPFRVGGPNFVLSDNEMWAATRHYFLHRDNGLDESTIVAYMNEKQLVPLLRLESQFDNSYPGLVLEEDRTLTVLYYSSGQDETTNIYISRLKLP
jgi:hypothetical protein